MGDRVMGDDRSGSEIGQTFLWHQLFFSLKSLKQTHTFIQHFLY